jgi:hypothetical protein
MIPCRLPGSAQESSLSGWGLSAWQESQISQNWQTLRQQKTPTATTRVALLSEGDAGDRVEQAGQRRGFHVSRVRGVAELERLLGAGSTDVLVVDTAHGHSQGVLDRVQWVKKRFPQVQVVGGNVATAAGALALSGAEFAGFMRNAGALAVEVDPEDETQSRA